MRIVAVVAAIAVICCVLVSAGFSRQAKQVTSTANLKYVTPKDCVMTYSMITCCPGDTHYWFLTSQFAKGFSPDSIVFVEKPVNAQGGTGKESSYKTIKFYKQKKAPKPSLKK
jgi:hypothetical protein